MITTYFIGLFTILNIFYLCLGIFASKSVTSTKDFFLAGKNVGFIATTLTLVATQIGGGMLTGTAEQAYIHGLYGLLYTIGMCIGFTILGLGLAARLQTLKVSTTAELFEIAYKSQFLRKVASILSVCTLTGILIAQILASRTLLHGIGLDYELLFIILWLFVIAYTMFGGLKAVIWTDSAQVLVIVGVFAWLFYTSISSDPKALFSLKNIFRLQRYFFGKNSINTNPMAVTFVMPALFSLIEQDHAQRFFAARNKGIASLSSLCASVSLIAFSLIPIYFGIKAKVLGLKVAAGSSPLIPVLKILTNDFMVAFALCAIMAAITSTADSILCAISSNLSQDFHYTSSSSKNLRVAQAITATVGLFSLACSYIMPQNIIFILVNAYSISVCCLLVPLIFAYLGLEGSQYTATVSIIPGGASLAVFSLYPIGIPKEFAALFINLMCYLIFYTLESLINSPSK